MVPFEDESWTRGRLLRESVKEVRMCTGLVVSW